MLAPYPIPPEFVSWNERWGSPLGREFPAETLLPQRVVRRLDRLRPRRRGPFAFQSNNSTRAFEYPWAYSRIAPYRGMRVVDVGGSNAGLQFVLASEGVEVTNVDPGEESEGLGWPVDDTSVERLNRVFGTDVKLINSTLQDAGLPADHFDVVYSISTIEHIPAMEISPLMSEIRRILRPGGRAVMTVDLFFDIEPFSRRTSNRWGTNIDVAELVRASGMELVEGDPADLLGFPEFDPPAVLGRLENLLVGSYPAGAQCFVLQRR